jgi:two-component system LytT family sensor kinase
MLIQPYVENAVKHGLLHKKDGVGKIDIYFEVVEKDLVVKIIDNGIGIKRSTEINKIRQDKSKSFATSANKKRLDILNDGRTDKISITFTELTNHNQQVTGTEVKLIIPLEYDL